MTPHRPRRQPPLRIVVSGPESAGKSTLAAWLAKRFGLPVAMEYARSHLADHPAPTTAADLLEIARRHRAWQRGQVPPDAPVGIFDTGMLNYLIWADVAFGSVPNEIRRWLDDEAGHTHLLCEPDLPWQADPLREYPEMADRRALFDRHLLELRTRQTPHFLIRGQGPTRQQSAEAVVAKLLDVTRT